MKLYQLDLATSGPATPGAEFHIHFGTPLGLGKGSEFRGVDRLEEADITRAGQKFLLTKHRQQGMVVEIFVGSDMPKGLIVVAKASKGTSILAGGGDGYPPMDFPAGAEIKFGDLRGLRRGTMVTTGGHAQNANGAIVVLWSERDSVHIGVFNTETHEALATGMIRMENGVVTGFEPVQQVIAGRVEAAKAGRDRIVKYWWRGETTPADPTIQVGEKIPHLSLVEWKNRLKCLLSSKWPKEAYKYRNYNGVEVIEISGGKRNDPTWGAVKILPFGGRPEALCLEEAQSLGIVSRPSDQWDNSRTVIEKTIAGVAPLRQIPRDFLDRTAVEKWPIVEGSGMPIFHNSEWLWKAIRDALSLPSSERAVVNPADLPQGWVEVCPWMINSVIEMTRWGSSIEFKNKK